MARRRGKHPPEQRRFGAHMSIAGGLHNALDRAVEAGCDCLQVFVKNQRQWRAPALTDEQIRLWRGARREAGVEPIVAHDAYLINLAAPDDAVWKKSIDAIVDESERCEGLEIGWLVTHPGSYLHKDERWGVRRISRALNELHRRTRGFRVRILLETTAGQGTSLGYRFEQLSAIMDRVTSPDRLRVCFDTCHVFSAGYDLCSDAGYGATMDALDAHLGTASVACFHLNDSKKPMGSRVDRHDGIGMGEMGRGPFRRLVNDERFFGVPMILETPKGQDDRGRDLDRMNLGTLRRLIH